MTNDKPVSQTTKADATSDLAAQVWQPENFGKLQNVRLHDQAGDFDYQVYVPKNYDPKQPTHLIVAYHGTADGDLAYGQMAKETGFDKKAEDNDPAKDGNVVLAYPIARFRSNPGSWPHIPLLQSASGRTYNIPGRRNMMDTWSDYSDETRSDAIIADVKNRLRVDDVSAVGFGDGGRFALAYSDDRPGAFKNVVVVDGTTFGDNKVQPSDDKRNVLIFHPVRSGDTFLGKTWDHIWNPLKADFSLPYVGGYGHWYELDGKMAKLLAHDDDVQYSQPSQQKVEAAVTNKCDPNSTQVANGDWERVTTYTQCQSGKVAEVQEKGAQIAWNDTHNGEGGWPVVGARTDHANSDRAWEFVLHDGRITPMLTKP